MSDRPFPHGGPCRHFTGLLTDECKVGVRYKTLPRAPQDGNSPLPCCRLVDGKKWCDQWDALTPNETQAKEDANAKYAEHVLVATMAIHETKEGRGSITCPRCLGVLRFAFASNKHIRARCETPNCLRFMS